MRAADKRTNCLDTDVQGDKQHRDNDPGLSP
jgi:hypothetical protein